MARSLGLETADREESQDFIDGGDYSILFDKDEIRAGEIVDEAGQVLGRHRGIIHYTIGQRRGLGIGGRNNGNEGKGPLYVVGIDAAVHRVIVGPQAALACHEVTLSEASWVAQDGAPSEDTAVLARLRNTAAALPATLQAIDGERVVLRLDTPQFGIASGQAAVLYDKENEAVVLGGGWISAAPAAGLG